MINASLILNIVVLIPVCFFIITNNYRMEKTFGTFTAARGILLAIYSTILLASMLLLFLNDAKLSFALFFMQIVYKLLSPFTVRTIKNPVVISNIFIAIFHSFTVFNMISMKVINFDFM